MNDNGEMNTLAAIGTLVVGFILLAVALYLLMVSNPTEEVNETINVTERQMAHGVLTSACYVVTDDNQWREVLCYEYPKLQPGHTYIVGVRKAVPRQMFFMPGTTNETKAFVEKLDRETNIYNNDMIVSVLERVE